MNTTSASPAEASADAPADRPTGTQGAGLGRAGARLPLADGAQLRRRLPHRRERALAAGARDAGLHDGGSGRLPPDLGPGGHTPRALREFRARAVGRAALPPFAAGAAVPSTTSGHNPAGALAIVGAAGLDAVVTAAAGPRYNDLGGEWIEEVHEAAANLMLALVGVHVAAVLLSAAGCTARTWSARWSPGARRGRPQDGVRSAWRSVAVLMLVAVLGFWWLAVAGRPRPASAAGPARRRPMPSTTTTTERPRRHATIQACASCWPKTIRCSATACGPACASSASWSTGCATARPPSANCAPSPTPPPCSTSACR